MSRKIIFILIILILIVAGFIGSYLYLQNKAEVNGTKQPLKLADFFPFGNNADDINTNFSTTTINTNEFEIEEGPLPRLRQISNTPIAGAGTIEIATGTSARYVDRATGHIYEAELSSTKKEKISNTTIPKIYEALWINKGNSVILRYVKDENEMIQSFYANLKKSTGTTTQAVSLEGTFFPENLEQIAVISGTQNKLFTLTSGQQATGFISQYDGSKKSQVWNSPITEWLATYPKEGIVALTTKPSADIDGFLYFLNTKTGGVERVLGNIKGLTTLTDPSATKILYSESLDRNIYLSIYDVTKKTNNSLDKNSFPEKCVWSIKNTSILYCNVPNSLPKGDYPDVWYKGLVSFSDSLWKIDVKNGSIDLISNLEKESSNDIDAINPILSEKENYLLFMNKKDLTLWSIDLTAPQPEI